jgi:hypothetical protein
VHVLVHVVVIGVVLLLKLGRLPPGPGLRGGECETAHVSAEQMLGTSQTFGLWEAGGCRVDLAEELPQETGAGVRGDLSRVVPGMQRMSGKTRTK